VILDAEMPDSASASITADQVLALDLNDLAAIGSAFGGRSLGQLDRDRVVVRVSRLFRDRV